MLSWQAQQLSWQWQAEQRMHAVATRLRCWQAQQRTMRSGQHSWPVHLSFSAAQPASLLRPGASPLQLGRTTHTPSALPQLVPALSKWGGAVVGLTLVAIGAMGLYETFFEQHEEGGQHAEHDPAAEALTGECMLFVMFLNTVPREHPRVVCQGCLGCCRWGPLVCMHVYEGGARGWGCCRGCAVTMWVASALQPSLLQPSRLLPPPYLPSLLQLTTQPACTSPIPAGLEMQGGVLVAKKERSGFGLATFATGIVYGLQVGKERDGCCMCRWAGGIMYGLQLERLLPCVCWTACTPLEFSQVVHQAHLLHLRSLPACSLTLSL